jgi:hypothetical protein
MTPTCQLATAGLDHPVEAGQFLDLIQWEVGLAEFVSADLRRRPTESPGNRAACPCTAESAQLGREATASDSGACRRCHVNLPSLKFSPRFIMPLPTLIVFLPRFMMKVRDCEAVYSSERRGRGANSDRAWTPDPCMDPRPSYR